MKRQKTHVAFSRREFVTNSLKAGLVLPFSGVLISSCLNKSPNSDSIEETVKPLKILILGGTSFLGPHQIAYAVDRGHAITTFTRGKTEPTVNKEYFKKVKNLIGDRENDLSALEDGKWDVVIDNSGKDAEWTKKSAALLKDKADLYIYTSSTGVYFPYLSDDIKEETELLLEAPPEIADEDLKMEYWFGTMKASSEHVAREEFGEERTLAIRPTYMMGPADRTDRFVHWPLRLEKEGELLVPGNADDPVQYIDVRDVAEWMIRCAENKLTGAFNAVGPEQGETMLDFVGKACDVYDREKNIVNVDNYQFLTENNIFYLLPWVMGDGNHYGTSRVNNDKAKANGLTFRPFSDSIKAIGDWWNSEAVSQERRDKYNSNERSILNRESEILDKWKAYKKASVTG